MLLARFVTKPSEGTVIQGRMDSAEEERGRKREIGTRDFTENWGNARERERERERHTERG